MEMLIIILAVILVAVATYFITTKLKKDKTVTVIDRVSMALTLARIIASDVSKDHYINDIIAYIFDAFFYVETIVGATKEDKIAEGVAYVKDLLVSNDIPVTEERENLILELFIITYDIVEFFDE